jgi:hypothetical protein
MEFFTEHMLEIIFGLISAGALAFCKYLGGQIKELKQLQDDKNESEFKALIQNEIVPLSTRIDECKRIAQQNEDASHKRFELILESYRFRLIQLSKAYLRQGYMTQDQFDQITEMYKVYHGLGGNGQAQDYYDRAMNLPVKERPDNDE